MLLTRKHPENETDKRNTNGNHRSCTAYDNWDCGKAVNA